jgi:chemotaxis protein methyltransferase CheR
MQGSVSPALLSELSKYLSDHIGLFFPEKRWSELEHKMLAAQKDFNFDNVEEFIRWLLSAPLTRQQVEVLAEHLTIKETYFFREEKTFDALEHTILPELIREKYRTEKRIGSGAQAVPPAKNLTP